MNTTTNPNQWGDKPRQYSYGNLQHTNARVTTTCTSYTSSIVC